ncbi:MAG: hypothetical protein NC930_01880, partial [Candidatus Omnitrophica bacterium]|nr:hypothetical protein [Candidatus Omnitrophota bacterium]
LRYGIDRTHPKQRRLYEKTTHRTRAARIVQNSSLPCSHINESQNLRQEKISRKNIRGDIPRRLFNKGMAWSK